MIYTVYKTNSNSQLTIWFKCHSELPFVLLVLFQTCKCKLSIGGVGVFIKVLVSLGLSQVFEPKSFSPLTYNENNLN